MVDLAADAFQVIDLTRPRPVVSVQDMHLEYALNFPHLTPETNPLDSLNTALTTFLDDAEKTLSLNPSCHGMDETVSKLETKSVDEWVSLIARIRRAPYRADWLAEFACFLNAIVRQNARSTPAQTGKLKTLNQGLSGVVARGAFPDPFAPLLFPVDKPPAFVLKTALERTVANYETRNEVIVGLYALNALRAHVPNFMYVYGAYECGHATKRPDGSFDMCDPERDPAVYAMVETIADGVPLVQFVHQRRAWKDVMLVLLQLCLALAFAQEQCGFCHNDLHGSNVLIRELGGPVTLRYTVGTTTFYVVTRHIVMLIDFGRSRVSFPLPPGVMPLPSPSYLDIANPTVYGSEGTQFNTGIVALQWGLAPNIFTRLNDLIFCVWSLHPHMAPETHAAVAQFLAPLYGGDPSVAHLCLIEYAEWPPVLPFNRDAELVPLVRMYLSETSDGKQFAGLVRESYDATTMPRLFQCTRDDPICRKALSDV